MRKTKGHWNFTCTYVVTFSLKFYDLATDVRSQKLNELAVIFIGLSKTFSRCAISPSEFGTITKVCFDLSSHQMTFDKQKFTSQVSKFLIGEKMRF